MSQTELARAMGVSHVTIGYWESEKTEPEDLATWRQLAKELHTTPEWLAFGAAPVTKLEPVHVTPRAEPVPKKGGRAG